MKLKLTPEAEYMFKLFLDESNLWVTSELQERYKGRYAGEIPAPFEYLADSFEEYFEHEFKEPNHRGSAQLARANNGEINISVLTRWLVEEQNEPEHQHLGKYLSDNVPRHMRTPLRLKDVIDWDTGRPFY